jgi:hypothetical protein
MKTLIKYKVPMFRGWLPGRTLRSLQEHEPGMAYNFDFDVYGRTIMIHGTSAAEAAHAMVKAFGGSFETII